MRHTGTGNRCCAIPLHTQLTTPPGGETIYIQFIWKNFLTVSDGRGVLMEHTSSQSTQTRWSAHVMVNDIYIITSQHSQQNRHVIFLWIYNSHVTFAECFGLKTIYY